MKAKTKQQRNLRLDVNRLKDVPIDSVGGATCNQAFVDRERGWVIQIWDHATIGCDGTPWEGTIQVAVKHNAAQTRAEMAGRDYSIPITWDELQAIKDWLWPGRIALEIYPPKSKVVNVADLRWLWVLPVSASLPFNLQSGKTTLTSGQ